MHTEEKRLRGDIWGLKQRSKDSGSISVTCPYMKFVLIRLFTFLLSSGKLVLECIWNKYAALKTSWSVSAEGLSVFLMLGDRYRWRLRTSPHPPRLTYPRSGLWQIQCLLGSLPGSLAIFFVSSPGRKNGAAVRFLTSPPHRTPPPWLLGLSPWKWEETANILT